MPITKAAAKANRQSQKRQVFNLRRKRAMNEAVKSIKKLLADKNPEEAKKQLPTAYKAIDKAAKRGVLKANSAARKKSRLSSAIKKAS